MGSKPLGAKIASQSYPSRFNLQTTHPSWSAAPTTNPCSLNLLRALDALPVRSERDFRSPVSCPQNSISLRATALLESGASAVLRESKMILVTPLSPNMADFRPRGSLVLKSPTWPNVPKTRSTAPISFIISASLSRSPSASLNSSARFLSSPLMVCSKVVVRAVLMPR